MSINATANYSKTFLIISLIFLLSLSVTAFGESPEEKGFEIAARSDRSDNGYVDSKVEMTMILRNAAGDETTRSINFTTLERENEEVGDKSLVLFNTPRDIKGTALLSHAQILKPDNQWLYLPALKRVKRISSSNQVLSVYAPTHAFMQLWQPCRIGMKKRQSELELVMRPLPTCI